MSKGRQVTRGWTDIHTGAALCFVLAAVTGLLGGLEPGITRIAILGLAVVCVAVGLFFDGFTGLVIGLVAAAAAVVVKRSTGVWDREQFLPAAAIAVCCLVLGWAAGLTGTRIREVLRGRERDRSEVRPVFGSLGLLSLDRAYPRLEDEITRARTHGRALGVVMIYVRITDTELDDSARQAVRRAVARLVESLLRDTDVPFAVAADEFGAILPETDSVRGWSVVGPIVDAAGRSTFTDRSSQQRRSVADCAEVYAGMSFLTGETVDADLLVERARAAHEFPVAA